MWWVHTIDVAADAGIWVIAQAIAFVLLLAPIPTAACSRRLKFALASSIGTTGWLTLIDGAILLWPPIYPTHAVLSVMLLIFMVWLMVEILREGLDRSGSTP